MSLRTAARLLQRNVPRLAARPAASAAVAAARLPLRTVTRPLGATRHASSTPKGDPGLDPSIAVRDLTDAEYADRADADMDLLHEAIEVLVEDFGAANWEVEYSSGVMTVTLPPIGTYVINKQPPNHQIWVSSPVSGPQRFSYGKDVEGWVHHRKAGVSLGALLDAEFKVLLKEQLNEEGWEGTGLK
ncbi:Frataxin, mitochondrial [Vanrija pseudolonga]|uniref:ferroxidase n=1 Tax=Vanrija pseudolonga TaxID=143232 RepID=A0AAF0XZY9_9TREE|nr:Frataxin, mitochondrial [Vanrija pseudolonga]